QRDQVRLHLLKAIAGPVTFKRQSKLEQTREKYLLLTLRVTSTNPVEKIDYQSWGDPLDAPGKHEPRLFDDRGQSYLRARFPAGTIVAGHVDTSYMTPGRMIDDT